MDNITIIPAQQMQEYFTAILRKQGFTQEKALRCAEIFTMNSVDGVYTHGVNRFPRFVKYVRDGFVKTDAEPSLVQSMGSIEKWNGNLGPGPLNAEHATDSAMRLASEHGIGCVAMANTNHWMRAGTYAWKAAKKGFAFIAWTNTIANMPAWGAVNAKLGNNPLVMALPYGEEAIVLDMALSQYSLGHMELAAMRNEKLSVNGGFDTDGNLTDDPSAIVASRRLLPAGYWKGSGMALLLDLLATVLSGGSSTAEISNENVEVGLSQVFIAIDLTKLGHHSSIAGMIENIITDYQQSIPAIGSQKVLYPGERVLHTREKNTTQGIPVQQHVWEIISQLYEDHSDLAHVKYI